ncbi:MAG TPA: type IV secretion system DNA-binding domain-containing protein [Solirubrobacteraceae bacterium]
MPASQYTNEAPANPLQPLSELVGWLCSTTLHIAIGVALGLLVVPVMRRGHLRWTWAACAIPVALLAHSILSGWAGTLGTAAVCASLRGRHWHAQDLMSGGDLAEIACERRGPSHALGALARRLFERIVHVSAWTSLREERVPIGRAQDGETLAIPFGSHSGGKHTLIVGATGSGKTVTETWLATRAIGAGLGAVVIDPKGDARMRAHLVEAAHLAERKFIEWTPTGPSVYNPFGHGGASEIADKALAGERFTEPHYQRQAQRYLGYAVRALRGAGSTVSLPALVKQLEPAQLEVLARTLPEAQADATLDYLESLSARQRTDLGGVRDRLAIMAESDVAPWLDPATTDAQAFDLLTAVRERAVVYFNLKADALPLLARMLGVAIVQDLQTTMAALQVAPIPTVVVIDEFAAIAAEQVVHLFGRARSAGLNLLLGTQEFSDLRLEGHTQFLEQVLGNLSAVVAHRQVVPESAELIARLGGSRGVWRATHTSDGRWTRTRTTKPLLASEDISGLTPGRAAVIELGGHSSARFVEVFSSVERPNRSLFVR